MENVEWSMEYGEYTIENTVYSTQSETVGLRRLGETARSNSIHSQC